MIKKILYNDALLLIFRIGLGLFLLYASYLKINNPAEFAQAIRAYEIIPDELSTLPAIFLPWIEMLCGLFLISGIFVQSSSYISAGLIAVFTVNVLIALLRGLEIDCGCGASISGLQKVGWGKIIENIILIFILLLISIKRTYIFALENMFVAKK